MKNKGFTLIELLVVVLIIGILAGVALPQYTKAVEKSRATEAITLLSNLAKAQEVYALGTNHYTNDMNSLDIQMPNLTDTGVVSTISTKAFLVTIRNGADAGTFQATATRRTGEYTIVASMPRGEALGMWCQAGNITTVADSAPVLGTGKNDKLCKSIANGDGNGKIIK